MFQYARALFRKNVRAGGEPSAFADINVAQTFCRARFWGVRGFQEALRCTKRPRIVQNRPLSIYCAGEHDPRTTVRKPFLEGDSRRPIRTLKPCTKD